MIDKILLSDCDAVPYLVGSSLSQLHNKEITLSTDKINVIVGPNGSGKSALLKALALKTLAFNTGITALDSKYLTGMDSDTYWYQKNSWGADYEFMRGIELIWSKMRAMYYQPNQIPGHENSINESMMCGYFEEAKAYARLTENKSSGEKGSSVLKSILSWIANPIASSTIPMHRWNYGIEIAPLHGHNLRNPLQIKALELKKMVLDIPMSAPQLILLDEPEQSLDAKQEFLLWKTLMSANLSRSQIVVVSHSSYPFLYSDHFHLIEAENHYVASTKTLLSHSLA